MERATQTPQIVMMSVVAVLSLTSLVWGARSAQAQAPQSGSTSATTASAAEAAFPRCRLGAAERERFMEHYGSGHLALAEGEFQEAIPRFERALKLCMEGELLWFLAVSHAQLGETLRAQNLMASWRAHRELHGLPLTEPGVPAWQTKTSQQQAPLATLPLPATSGPSGVIALGLGRSAGGTYPIPLPATRSSSSFTASVTPATSRAMQTSAASSQLSIITEPPNARIWVEGFGELGLSPIQSASLPAQQLTLIITLPGYRPTTRHLSLSPDAHHRLYITLLPE